MLAPKSSTYNGRPSFANPKYLKKAQSEKPCLYEIPYNKDGLTNIFAPDREETLTLEKESRSKLNKDKVKPDDYTKQNSLYEIFKPPSREYLDQLAHYVQSLEKEIDELEFDKAVFSNIYDLLLQECVSKDVMCSYLHSLSDLDAHTELQCLYLYKIKECECLAENLSKQTKNVSKEVYNELLQSFAKLEKHLISLELYLQQCQKQIKNDTVCKEKVSPIYLKEREQYFEIQDSKSQLQDKNIAISDLKKLNEKCKGKYVETKFDKPFVVRQPNALKIPKPSILGKPILFQNLLRGTILQRQRIIHITSVSRPLLKSTQMKEKVVHNNSQVKYKKNEVEDHHRIYSISNKTKSVTACNDSLKFGTLNVNVVCATCGICVVNLNHDACVYKFINDVNARTKMPKVVPISTRKPKIQANKSVATPHKKIVASDPTIQKSKSYFRMMYENTNKAWKWWIENNVSQDINGFLRPKRNGIQFKYLGTVRFGNDQFAPILGYGDLVQGKAKRSTFKTKTVPSSKGLLNLLHMDLCGLMRVKSINGRKYILVIIDDYSRYTWTHFLKTKDETPEVLKDFLKMIQPNLQAQVITVRTDKGPEFLNKTLHAYFKEEGIEHQTSSP
ncbi:retrovirus-related pol polyprotein from transposon TNT 1-94 [Tanacetum coccineum]